MVIVFCVWMRERAELGDGLLLESSLPMSICCIGSFCVGVSEAAVAVAVAAVSCFLSASAPVPLPVSVSVPTLTSASGSISMPREVGISSFCFREL